MLDNYTLSYYITILPKAVIYSSITKASEYLNFKENLFLPDEYKTYPIDCFFCLYDSEGELVSSAHEQTTYLSLKAVINVVPLKMLTAFFTQVSKL